MDYREELELAVEAAESKRPQDAYDAAMYSLHYGPAGGGADMSWGDAIAALRGWADDVRDVRLIDIVYDEDEDGEEVECEVELGCIDAADIVRGVVGRELAGYL